MLNIYLLNSVDSRSQGTLTSDMCTVYCST